MARPVRSPWMGVKRSPQVICAIARNVCPITRCRRVLPRPSTFLLEAFNSFSRRHLPLVECLRQPEQSSAAASRVSSQPHPRRRERISKLTRRTLFTMRPKGCCERGQGRGEPCDRSRPPYYRGVRMVRSQCQPRKLVRARHEQDPVSQFTPQYGGGEYKAHSANDQRLKFYPV